MKNKFSIITPTHIKTPFLDELWQSIKEQTYKRWEWIIYLNGMMGKHLLSSEIRNDKRVKIYQQERVPWFHMGSQHQKIGYIKNKAFNLGEGDVLVEADHDDMLTTDCLEELNKVFQNDTGFAYSNCATIGQKKPFSSELGWKHTVFKYKGEDLIAMTAFEPTYDRIASMWFSPHHVRAWKKDVYKGLGGHDIDLFVCDDLDLIIRTYLKHKMVHIDKTLYIYRITGYNSCMLHSSAIHQTAKVIKEKYATL